MSFFKCKMCGGTIEFEPGSTVGVCDSCGSKQTLPRLDSERKVNLYDRASHFRRNNDFDKAMAIYEQILNEDSTDAESYWSLVLCRYGIEYVEDPTSHKRIPTVNRAQFTSILADEDYKSAVQYADMEQRLLYEEEAKAIDEIQKGILAISQKEKPFDVFICYKETDANGRRTQDSVLATELYHELTKEDFKVFFARITLEDKLGQEYEPYIFAALNSARAMVVLGTKPEYFNAVWVKNEWSRYLALIRNGAKKTLIPAYRDMDPYDLPEEFSHLQAQDMSKLGFMQDLVRGIRKIIGQAEASAPTVRTVAAEPVQTAVNTAPLLERSFLFLEDGNWSSANEYCEKVLDQEPKNAQAYLVKLMVGLRVRTQEELKNCEQPFDANKNCQKVLRFADPALADELKGYIKFINERNEHARLCGIYNDAVDKMKSASTEDAYKAAASVFKSIPGFEDADQLAEQCLEQAEISRKDAIYAHAKQHMTGETTTPYETAIKSFQTIAGWKDSEEQIAICRKRIEEINIKKEQQRKDQIYNSAIESKRLNTIQDLESAIQRFESISDWKDSIKKIDECSRQIEILEEQEAKAAKRKKTVKIMRIILIAAIIFAILIYLCIQLLIIPEINYKDAVALMEEGKYEDAISAFKALDGYRDSDEQIKSCQTSKLDVIYDAAIALKDAGEYDQAISQFKEILGHRDSWDQISACETGIKDKQYGAALTLMETGRYEEAISSFNAISGYRDSKEKIEICQKALFDIDYNAAIVLMEAGKYDQALNAFQQLSQSQYSTEISNDINMYIKDINFQLELEHLKSAKIGEIINFGYYEQDNDSSNGKEPIEWLILEKENGRALLISRYALDCIKYNSTSNTNAWSESPLRDWLNDFFVNAAFSSDEFNIINNTEIIAENDPELHIKKGEDTIDKVFVLSKNEAEDYRMWAPFYYCKGTPYCLAKGIQRNSLGYCKWWLRTPGQSIQYSESCLVAIYDVSSSYSNYKVDQNNIAVRPSIWVSYE